VSQFLEKQNKYSWAVVFLIALLQAGFIIIRFSGWGYDDAFITFRYAENLYQGVGFVYNPGEKILSTTTPFFTFLLVLLRHLSPNLPQLAFLVGTISLPIGGLFLWDLAYQQKHPITAWFSLLIYPIFPLLLSTLSSEMSLFLALCLVALAFYARSRFTIAAVCLAFATLTRPEGGLVVILLIMHYALIHRKPPPWRAILTFVLLCAPWIIFSTLYFGSPIPATLAAKQIQGTMVISQGFAPGLFTILNQSYISRWQYWFMGFLSVIGILSMFQSHNQKGWFLPAWGLCHFIALTLLGVTSYFWYYAPIIPGIITLSGLGLESLLSVLQKQVTLRLRTMRVVGLATVFILGLTIGKHAIEKSQFPDQRIQIYRAVGEWIQTHTAKETSVGTLEVGIIGYYAQRRMIDFAGIIQPEISEKLTASTTYADSTTWAIQTYHPEILVFTENQIPEEIEKIIDSQCGSGINFEGADYGYLRDLLLVKCNW
jgi:hypothetical protein